MGPPFFCSWNAKAQICDSLRQAGADFITRFSWKWMTNETRCMIRVCLKIVDPPSSFELIHFARKLCESVWFLGQQILRHSFFLVFLTACVQQLSEACRLSLQGLRMAKNHLGAARFGSSIQALLPQAATSWYCRFLDTLSLGWFWEGMAHLWLSPKNFPEDLKTSLSLLSCLWDPCGSWGPFASFGPALEQDRRLWCQCDFSGLPGKGL